MFPSTMTTLEKNFRPIIVTHLGVWILDLDFTNEDDAFDKALEVFQKMQEAMDFVLIHASFDKLIDNR